MKQKFLAVIVAGIITSLFAHGQTPITTAEELQDIGRDAVSLRGRYVLASDIEVEDWIPIGEINAPFQGVFDGGGYTITVRSIGNAAAEPYRARSVTKIPGEETFLIGLFGSTGRRSLVQNVRITGEITFEGDGNVVTGGIAGANFGQILNCITETVTEAKNFGKGDCFAGGIAGINNGVVRNCYTTGDIEAFGGINNYAGGLAGVNDTDAGTIQFCYASGDVSAIEGGGDCFAGGIAGLCARGASVQYGVAFNSAIVTDGTDEAHHLTGRIVGKNFGRIGGNYSRRDMTLAMDVVRANDRSIFAPVAIQDRLWWERYARYAFGNASARPWTWNETTGLPALFWENRMAPSVRPARERQTARRADLSARDMQEQQDNRPPVRERQTARQAGKTVEIHTVEDLQSVSESLSALEGTYILMNDLTLEDWTPTGVIGDRESFNGVFDGNGHTLTLSGLAEGQARRFCLYGGIFGEIGKRGIVKNLRVKGNPEFSSGEKSMFFGCIAAENNGIIECCVSEMDIMADGGLYTAGNKWASFAKGAAMSNATRTVTGFFEWGVFAGGIVGVNHGTVRDCYSTGDIRISGKGYKCAGGIAGGNDNILLNCYATGNLTAEGDGASRYTGGLAGINNQTNENCVALNEELTARGKSGGAAPAGVSLEWNVNIALGIAARDYKQQITNSFFRDDMIFNREDEQGNAQKKSFGEKVQVKGREVTVEDTENRSWWQNIGKRNTFRFSDHAPDAPWFWDSELRRPILYWETEIATDNLPLQDDETLQDDLSAQEDETDASFRDEEKEVDTFEDLSERTANASYDLAPWKDRNTGKWGLRDRLTREIIVPARYDEIDIDMENGFFLVGIEGKGRGFLDNTGKEIIPLKYECIFHEIPDKNQSGVYSFGTTFVIQKTDRSPSPQNKYFTDGTVIIGQPKMSGGIRSGATYGFVNDRGKEITPFIYTQAFPFREGRALVSKESRIGFIDKNGQEVIPCIYSSAGFFVDGKSKVKLGDEEFYIDKNGKRLP
jgi:hypothetical protein